MHTFLTGRPAGSRAARRTRSTVLAAAALATAAIAALAVASRSVSAQETADTTAQATEQAATEKKEPMSFRDLKAWLPEKLGDLKRTDARGEKVSGAGIHYTTAEGDYGVDTEDDSDSESPSAHVVVIDWSAHPDMGQASAFWVTSGMEIDNESDTDYSKTTTIDGLPAFVQYNFESKSGDVTIYIKPALVVALHVSGMEDDMFKTLQTQLNVKALAEKYGAAPTTQPSE